MKKILLIAIAAIALSCDGNSGSSSHEGNQHEDAAPLDASGSDTSSIHSDTTTTGGLNRQNQYDTLK